VGIAAVILLGIIGAMVYRPETYQEYLARKKSRSEARNTDSISPPQSAVEEFLKAAVSPNPSEAMKYVEGYENSFSTVDNIMKFLDIQVPLTFSYQIRDVSFNSTGGKIEVDLLTQSGALNKEIVVKNYDGNWKLTEVKSKNDNKIVFQNNTGTISMLLPQDMLSQSMAVDIGETYTIYDAENSIQIVLLITQQEVSELLSEMVDCSAGICKTELINNISFKTFELIDPTTGEYAYVAEAEDGGTYITIIGKAVSKEKMDVVKEMVQTVRI
jgi:hypothetical protein